MTLYVIDPGLNNYMGHHATVDKLIVEEGKKRTEVKLLGFIDIEEQVKQDLGAVEWFNFHTYMNVSNDPICSWLEKFSVGQEVTYRDLATLHNVTAGDTILVPSCNAAQLLAIIRFTQTNFKVGKAPKVFVRFGYDGGYHKDGRFNIDSAFYRFSANTLRDEFKGNFRFGTWHPKHSWQMSEVIKRQVELWPDPIAPGKTEKKNNDVPVVGFMGHWRIGRGAPLLPDIIKGLKNCNYYLHNSGPREEFAKQWEGLNVDNTAYSPEQYTEKLRSVDVLVLPYLRQAYDYGPSGLLTEAIVNGIPCVVPAKSAISEMAQQYGHTAVFHEDTIESVHEAVHEALVNLPQLKKQAEEGAAKWNAVNGPEKFMDVVLNG
jgi:glycosyltransferase involved in cell wall biosynthesis